MTNNQPIKIIYLFFIITLLIMVGCKERDSPAPLNIYGTLTDYSECKNEKSGSISNDWDTNYCFQYTYEIDSMKLYMKHLNALFSCCNFGLYTIIEEVNDTIIIQEFENDDPCSCICEFDLDFMINNVEKKFYWIKLVVPKYEYCTGENPMIFPIDLSINDEGEYCW
jgi:hypothetical protein